MKFTCQQKDLNFALDVVSRAITPNNTLPVLNNILIKTSGKKVLFSATNLEIAVSFFLTADVSNEGSITIPAKLITSYVNLLEEGKIELKTEEGFVLYIKAKNSETRIKGISADEFPIIPTVEKEQTFVVSSKTLTEAIEETVFSTATTPTRPVLSGVYLCVEKDTLKMVATDSYRLAEKKIKLEKKTEKSIECIIPARTLLELGRILSVKYEQEPVEVQTSKNQILFMVDGIELTSRLIEGKFPDYEKIIPRAARTKLEVPSDKLSIATKRVSLFARENNNNIKLTATNDGRLLISTDETRVGEEKAEVEIKITGENNKIAVNSQYLLDALNHIDEKATIELDEKLTPVVIRPFKHEDLLYIIMPLKV